MKGTAVRDQCRYLVVASGGDQKIVRAISHEVAARVAAEQWPLADSVTVYELSGGQRFRPQTQHTVIGVIPA